MLRRKDTLKDDGEQPFIAHLVELRDRLIRSIVVVGLLFGGLSFWANDLYALLAGPLTRHLPPGAQMIAIGVASPFLAPLKLTLFVALVLGVPYLLYQAWAFIAPGLYQHEKKLALPLLVASIVLFYGGMAFAYFVVFPLIFQFMVMTAPKGVAVMTDINQYMDFVLTLFIAFGVSFQVPIATILLVVSGLVTRESIADKRPYAIVFAFVIGAVLTPPDVVSQTLMAVPIWILFELGLIFSRLFVKDTVPSS
ncbi:MAG: twin-arginine translocase subunit TatC [Gammaproteobacteria bacterium]|jgi:sec-independent protein translocase protein TatC|nr:twin-arginine translocase subunit TatC [Gammaproteobacteria bacterium]NBT44541.1 twin-arginine translocase subunit TatC [Gammaproteobacteria bacterium]NBY21601.1 twin-arginine translocase subunit TatC [Gammaproteobacteria bacterium]NDE33566.1 twin-arginine translocase subunit TatC [Gammaproteobacteria bacterium]NDE55564.1 twin-arginine translocase subunit TatC [Gammaproteobacteria bacterium]